MATSINEFIQGLPKAELHLHIEGTFEPELMFELAQRNQVKLPYASVEELRDAYQFNNLQDFLDIYYQGMSVLKTRQDYFDLTWAYLQRVHQQSVKHVELFFDPQAHLERGIGFDTFFEGMDAALQKGQSELGISYGLILCFLRHLSEEDAIKTLELAKPYLSRISGVGLDSSELGHPPSKFQKVYQQAAELGLHLVAHAGEEGPPEYIVEALDLLQVQRIDHGNSCLADAVLVQRLVESQMALTVCPLSNVRLCVVDDITNHPLPNMLEQGLKVTVNSDDPAYFGGYINENFAAISPLLGDKPQTLAQLAMNSFDAAFLPEAEKTRYRDQVADYLKQWPGEAV